MNVSVFFQKGFKYFSENRFSYWDEKEQFVCLQGRCSWWCSRARESAQGVKHPAYGWAGSGTRERGQMPRSGCWEDGEAAASKLPLAFSQNLSLQGLTALCLSLLLPAIFCSLPCHWQTTSACLACSCPPQQGTSISTDDPNLVSNFDFLRTK